MGEEGGGGGGGAKMTKIVLNLKKRRHFGKDESETKVGDL